MPLKCLLAAAMVVATFQHASPQAPSRDSLSVTNQLPHPADVLVRFFDCPSETIHVGAATMDGAGKVHDGNAFNPPRRRYVRCGIVRVNATLVGSEIAVESLFVGRPMFQTRTFSIVKSTRAGGSPARIIVAHNQ